MGPYLSLCQGPYPIGSNELERGSSERTFVQQLQRLDGLGFALEVEIEQPGARQFELTFEQRGLVDPFVDGELGAGRPLGWLRLAGWRIDCASTTVVAWKSRGGAGAVDDLLVVIRAVDGEGPGA